jgi:hypothetical protein
MFGWIRKENGTNNIQEKLEENIFYVNIANMKKYLLSLHGDFESKDMCKDIAAAITPIVDSPHLKFSYRKNNLLFCFESEVEQQELNSYIEGSLFGLFTYYILSVVDDNLSVCMDEGTKGHLFDVQNDSEDVDMRIDMKKEMYFPDESAFYIEGDEDTTFIESILNDLKGRLRKPSLDEILDKIRDEGMESISQYEKDILDNFGK